MKIIDVLYSIPKKMEGGRMKESFRSKLGGMKKGKSLKTF
jgi:hypothetical protein